MSIAKTSYAFLQKIGKSLMLPVAVLPIAGILLGVGSANFAFLPTIVSQVMAQSGSVIFGNLPILFAIGTVLGLTGNDGVSGLAAIVGYIVMVATMGVMAKTMGYDVQPVMGIDSINTGVFGGILIGCLAAWVFKSVLPTRAPFLPWFFSVSDRFRSSPRSWHW